MKQISLKGLKEKCWRLYSEIRRRKAADKDGYVSCVSCGKVGFWEKDGMQAGHFLHGGKGGNGNAVSYDDRNIHVQCQSCNYFGARDAAINYSDFMYKTYGPDILQTLKSVKGQSKLRREDFEKMIEHFKKELEKLP